MFDPPSSSPAVDPPGATGPTTGAAETARERRKQIVELIGAVIIGIAALLTAFASYRGGQQDGEVSKQSTEGIAFTLLANEAFTTANAQEAIERDWIFTWVAESENETPAAGYFAEAMPDEVFALALEWSDAVDDGIVDPFSFEARQTYDSYASLQSVEISTNADALDDRASCAFFESQVAEIRADRYGLSTVVLAIALVVGGIASLLQQKPGQIIVLIVATLSLVFGAAVLVIASDEIDARTETAVSFFGVDGDEALPGEDALALAEATCSPET